MKHSMTRGVSIDRTLDEIEKYHNQLKKYGDTPDIRQLKDYELCVIDDGSSVSLGLRGKNKLYRVELTEV